jgi:hypothetical protein
MSVVAVADMVLQTILTLSSLLSRLVVLPQQ